MLCCYVYVLCQLANIDNFLEAQLDSPATLRPSLKSLPPQITNICQGRSAHWVIVHATNGRESKSVYQDGECGEKQPP